MVSFRSRIYKYLLRRALRSGLLPEGLEGLEMARSGERRGGMLNANYGQSQYGAAHQNRHTRRRMGRR